jgi:hypothetical protein
MPSKYEAFALIWGNTKTLRPPSNFKHIRVWMGPGKNEGGKAR